MKYTIELDMFERDLLIETIEQRLETDKILIINDSLRREIEDLLDKIQDE